MTLSGILAWLIFGLVVGLIARVVMPGPQPMGWLLTIALGIAGSFVGGAIGAMIAGAPLETIHTNPAGWIGSILGALLLLIIYGFVNKRQTI